MSNKRDLLATTLAACAGFALIAVPAAAAGPAGTATLRGTASPAAAGSPRVGAVAAVGSIDFQVQLRMRDQAGATALARAVSTPTSVSYRHYLTTAQWERRFSPSAAEVSAVSAFLRRQGFKMHGASADRMAVSATGTAAQVQRTFATSLAYHKVYGARLRLAEKDFSLPAGLARYVVGVSGVNQTLARPGAAGDPARAPSGISTPPTSAPATSALPQPAGVRSPEPCGRYYGQKLNSALPPFGAGYPFPDPWAVCGYVPGQLRSVYSTPPGLDGSGTTVAIIDAYASPTILSDAQTYARRHDPAHPLLSSQFRQVLPDSFTMADACNQPEWFTEETLDVEAVHAMAPGAQLIYAGARSCADALEATLRKVVDGHLAQVVVNSWGVPAGDLTVDPSTRFADDEIFVMAADTGISVVFDSGDSGDEFTTVGLSVPGYPASSPFVTTVGGTTLQIGAAGQRLGEFGWSTARSFLCNETVERGGGCSAAQLGHWLPIDLALDGGSGGGTSYVYRQPLYQAGVVPAAISERNAAAIGNGDPARVEPDIAMDGDPATGLLIGETQTFPEGVHYGEYRLGGTSLAGPLFAGVVALADQAAGRSLGFLNPKLYSLPGESSALYDVLPAGRQDMSRFDYANEVNPINGRVFSTRLVGYQGTEQFCDPSAPTACATQDVSIPALVGYDGMTGLGAPGPDFVRALTKP